MRWVIGVTQDFERIFINKFYIYLKLEGRIIWHGLTLNTEIVKGRKKLLPTEVIWCSMKIR